MPFAIKPAALAKAATLLLGCLQAVAGFAILAPAAHSARAAEPMAFTLPADEGYGVEDCMTAGSSCGQAVADSFCAAHGHARAVAFGARDDVTGSVPATSSIQGPAAAPGDMLIRCGDD